MDRAGVVKIVLGAGVFLLWWRGYLSELITQAGAALATPPTKVPFAAPGTGLPALHPAATGLGAGATGRGA